MAGIKEHGLRLDELPSIVLPIYYGLFPILVCASAFVYGFAAALLLASLWQAPILLVSFIKMKKRLEWRSFFSLAALYNVYFAARFTALMTTERRG